MQLKPQLNFFQILNMSFGFLGIQIGLALQNANASRIFQTLGADIDKIPLLWIAAPVTGLLVQPIVGYMSDRTWCSLGRRRPYFLIGAILSSLALFIMPNSPMLWIAASMLWILDASINISMEPFRALVADILPPEQRNVGFCVQSFLIGIGSVAASCLPYILTNWFGLSNTAPKGEIPITIHYAFYIGAICFFSAVAYTVFTTKEYPPENLEEFEKHKKESAGFFKGVKDIGLSLKNMPKTMKQLAVVQFFSWFALFSMWIYSTPAVAEYFYHTTDPKSKAYNDSGDWVGVLFAAYNAVAAIVAIFLPILANKLGRRNVHSISLILGSLGFASFYLIPDPKLLLIAEIGIGFAWCSILAMPYAILSSSIPPEKMGVYMGIFNFFITIPQIISAGIIGLLVKYCFGGKPIYALLAAAISFALAAIFVQYVDDKDDKPSTLGRK